MPTITEVSLERESGPPEARAWLTLGQACKALCVDESTLRRWADGGHIRAFRTPGGHRRFARPDIKALLESKTKAGANYTELGDLTVSRVRKRLNQRPAQDSSWISAVNESSKERLRPLGRRLAELTAAYLGRRARRAALLDDARALGREYGRELARARLSLPQAVEAFIFFRRSLDEATKQASQQHGLSAKEALGACEQVTSLADQVLVGLTEAYEQEAPGPGGTAR